jgi:hypothetical protein
MLILVDLIFIVQNAVYSLIVTFCSKLAKLLLLHTGVLFCLCFIMLTPSPEGTENIYLCNSNLCFVTGVCSITSSILLVGCGHLVMNISNSCLT